MAEVLHFKNRSGSYLPTIKSSRSVAEGLTFLHRSIVKSALALLKIDVREVIIADIITAISNPLIPETTDTREHKEHKSICFVFFFSFFSMKSVRICLNHVPGYLLK